MLATIQAQLLLMKFNNFYVILPSISQIHHNNAHISVVRMRGSTTMANAMNMLFINSQPNLMIVVKHLCCVDLLFFENISWDKD